MNDSLAFPAPEAGDPEDVTWTLQTAGTMWARGDAHEAVRWLRRAAEAAVDAGNDLRAVALARAAADLTHSLGLTSALPPPVASGSADQTNRMDAAITPVEDAERTDTEFTIPNGMHAVDAPKRFPMPPPRNRAAASPPPPLPPPQRAAPSSNAPPLRRSAVPSSRPHAPASAQPPPSRPLVSPNAGLLPLPPLSEAPITPPAPATRSSRTSVTTASPSHIVRAREALRVAVMPAPDDQNLLWVRPLGDDEPLPVGCQEALLTAIQPGAQLLSKKH